MESRKGTNAKRAESIPLLEDDQFTGRVPGYHQVPESHRVIFEVDAADTDIENGHVLPQTSFSKIEEIARLLDSLSSDDEEDERQIALQILPSTSRDSHDDHTNNDPILDNSEEANGAASPENAQQEHVHRPQSKWRFVLYAFPVADALFDAVETCTGLIDGPMAFNAPVTLINFFSTFGLNAKFGVTGTEDLVFVLKNIRSPKVPPQWNENPDHTVNEKLTNLSLGSEITAFTIATIMTSLAAVGDAVQCYYFMEELPRVVQFDKSNYFYPTPWKAFSGAVAALEALSVITSEGPASWREGRNILAGVHRQYRTTVGRIIGRTVGIPLGIGDALRDGLLSYIGIMYIFNFSGNLAKAGVGVWGFMAAVCNYSTNGQNIVDHFDRFFAAFVADEEGVVQAKDYKNIVSLIISAGAGGLFGYAQKQLIEEELTKLAESFGMEKPILVLAMAYWVFGSVSVNSTGNVFDLVYLLVNASEKGAQWLWNKIKCGNCCAPDDPFDPENIAAAEYLDQNDLSHLQVLVEDYDNTEQALSVKAEEVRQRQQQRNLEELFDGANDDEADLIDFNSVEVVVDPAPKKVVASPQADTSRLFRSHSTPHMEQKGQDDRITLRFSH